MSEKTTNTSTRNIKINNKNAQKSKSIPDSFKNQVLKLKDKFALDEVQPKPKKGRGYAKDLTSFKSDNLAVTEQPEPKFIVPKKRGHSKRSIIEYFKRVYKHEQPKT